MHNAVRLQTDWRSSKVVEDVDQGVLVGDGLSIADLGPLDAEFLGPGVDACGGHTLLVDVLVDFIVAVDRVFKESKCDRIGVHGQVAVSSARVAYQIDQGILERAVPLVD